MPLVNFSSAQNYRELLAQVLNSIATPHQLGITAYSHFSGFLCYKTLSVDSYAIKRYSQLSYSRWPADWTSLFLFVEKKLDFTSYSGHFTYAALLDFYLVFTPVLNLSELRFA